MPLGVGREAVGALGFVRVPSAREGRMGGKMGENAGFDGNRGTQGGGGLSTVPTASPRPGSLLLAMSSKSALANSS